MELTYQSPKMPASYITISSEEMTYIDGGFEIDITPADVANFALNMVVNFTRMMGKAAFAGAIGGLVVMHKDGMSLSQSISYYWDGQTTAGRVATVVVGGFAGLYVYQQVMNIYTTLKGLYTELKNAYEMSQTQTDQTAATQSVGLVDPIVAAAA